MDIFDPHLRNPFDDFSKKSRLVGGTSEDVLSILIMRNVGPMHTLQFISYIFSEDARSQPEDRRRGGAGRWKPEGV